MDAISFCENKYTDGMTRQAVTYIRFSLFQEKIAEKCQKNNKRSYDGRSVGLEIRGSWDCWDYWEYWVKAQQTMA